MPHRQLGSRYTCLSVVVVVLEDLWARYRDTKRQGQEAMFMSIVTSKFIVGSGLRRMGLDAMAM